MNRKLRMGMIGGGRGAFIGAVHRMAASLDNRIEIVSCALSSDPKRAVESGRDWRIADDRNYPSFEAMIEAESALPPDARMDFVAIATPNFMHLPPARLALENGFHVVCDKPLALSLKEALALKKIVDRTGLLFALTHNYTGYPMVKQARHLARGGKLGKVRKIVVEYPQGWLSTLLEKTGQKQAEWRSDPKRAGAANCLGDIGTHAENLVEYITGLKIEEMLADVSSIVPGRKMDDDANILVHYDNGARGIVTASQVSIGEENALRIRIYGEKGGLEWSQQEPNSLILKWPDQPIQFLRTGVGYADPLSPAALAATRLPAGHPEGFIEAFANIYKNFADALTLRLAGKKLKPESLDFPDVNDGVHGMAFIETAIKSSKSRKWVKFPKL